MKRRNEYKNFSVFFNQTAEPTHDFVLLKRDGMRLLTRIPIFSFIITTQAEICMKLIVHKLERFIKQKAQKRKEFGLYLLLSDTPHLP